jgi:hypothetical protein
MCWNLYVESTIRFVVNHVVIFVFKCVVLYYLHNCSSGFSYMFLLHMWMKCNLSWRLICISHASNWVMFKWTSLCSPVVIWLCVKCLCCICCDACIIKYYYMCNILAQYVLWFCIPYMILLFNTFSPKNLIFWDEYFLSFLVLDNF